jgi:hypothetical protein
VNPLRGLYVGEIAGRACKLLWVGRERWTPSCANSGSIWVSKSKDVKWVYY